MGMWDSKQLWMKAKTYAELANKVPHNNPHFPFWSSLSLEFLGRAALTKIHPVLNADPREDTNLLYACGFSIVGQPRSIPAHSLFLRLEKTVPGFTKSQRELCDFLAMLRNQELHTGELPFANLKESKWLPRYYETCKILCASLKKTLPDLFDKDIAATAETLISTLAKQTESAVKQRIADHAKAFISKSKSERSKMTREARIALLRPRPAIKYEPCPACKTKGTLSGDLIKELAPKYVDDRLSIDQEFLASQFTCLACGLTLKNADEVALAGMEPRFTDTRETDLHELYEPEYEEEYDNM